MSLKTTNPEARIPRGFELKNSIVQGDESATEEIIKDISSSEARNSLGQLLIDLLDNTTDTFLKNTITATLRWCYRETLFTEADRLRIASTVSRILVYNEGQKALQQNASVALRCAQDAHRDYVERLVSKYEQEISQVAQPPDSLPETVNALYVATEQPSALSDVLNKRFEGWANSYAGLELLLKFSRPKNLMAIKRSRRLRSWAKLLLQYQLKPVMPRLPLTRSGSE